MTRMFDAPRALVFDAFTKPEFVRRWLLGPDGWTMPVCAIDLKVGGGYRYEWKNENEGTTMGVRGVYREITRPSRLVHTEAFDESWYPGECVVTTVFEEKDGRTQATMTLLYASAEARDGVLKSGMERGVSVSYDRLSNILDEPHVLQTAAQDVALLRVTIPRERDPEGHGTGPPGGHGRRRRAGRDGHGPLVHASPAHGPRRLRLRDRRARLEADLPRRPREARHVARDARWRAPSTRAASRASPPAWGRFDAWIRAEGLAPAGDLWERYLRGPESGPDSSQYRTEFNRPLLG